MEKERIPTAAEINAQIPVARARGIAARTAGLRALNVWYDPAGYRLMLILTNQASVGIPITTISHLPGVKPAELHAVTLTSGGGGVCWDKLDVDLSVEGLLVDTFGRRPFTATRASHA